MIRTLLGFLHPTSGGATRARHGRRARVGRDPAAAPATCPAASRSTTRSRGEEVLDYLVDLQGREPHRRAELCERLELPASVLQAKGARLLARHAPEDRRGAGAAARSGAGHPRRADRGARPAHAARLLRHPRRPATRGSDGLLQLARPLGGGATVRPGRDHPRRPPDGDPRRRASCWRAGAGA